MSPHNSASRMELAAPKSATARAGVRQGSTSDIHRHVQDTEERTCQQSHNLCGRLDDVVDGFHRTHAAVALDIRIRAVPAPRKASPEACHACV